MDINQVKSVIERIDTTSPFLVSSDSMVGYEPIGQLLLNVFEAGSVTIENITKGSDYTSFTGSADKLTFLHISVQRSVLSFAFEEKDGFLLLHVSMAFHKELHPFQELSFPFSLTQPRFMWSTSDYDCKTYGKIAVGLQIKEKVYPAAVSYLCGVKQWQLCMFDTGEDTDAEPFTLGEIFSLIGLGGQEDLLPDGLLTLVREVMLLRMVIGFDFEKKKITDWEVEISVLGENRWEIAPSLAAESLKLILRSTDDRFYVSIAGRFSICNVETVIFMNYDTKQKLLTVRVGDEPIRLGSIRDLAAYIGEVDMDSLLSKGYDCGALFLEEMYLSVSLSGSGIESFLIQIGMEHIWQFESIFSIDKVSMGYSDSQDENNSLFFTGEMSFGGSGFLVEAFRQEKGDFRVSAASKEPVPLSGMVKAVYDSVMKETRETVSLPKCTLTCISMSYGSNNETGKVFELSAGVTVSSEERFAEDFLAFEEISADFSLSCKKQAAGWQMEGAVTGYVKLASCGFALRMTFGKENSSMELTFMDDPSVFNLESFMQRLGFTELFLPEGLNLSLKEIKFTYDFTSKKLVLITESGQGGHLYFGSDIWKDGTEKRRYIFGVQLGIKAGFGELPVAGGMSDKLDEIQLTDFKLIAVSQDIEGLDIDGIAKNVTAKKGAILGATLILPDGPEEFSLALSSKKKEGCLNSGNSRELMDGEKKEEGLVLEINKNIGPVMFRKLHISYASGHIWFGIGAALQNKTLFLELDDLSLGCSLKDFSAAFAIKGISAGVDAGAITISGGFLKEDADTYTGSLLISAAGIALSAIGAYTEKPCKSFFVFAALRGNIGGPPCFYVTGLAAGFGYNRSLVVPDIEGIEEFSLLKAAQGKIADQDILEKDKEYFPPKVGQMWFAAGILFNTFKMADSTAVLAVSMGEELEIDLVGRTELNVPFDEKEAPAAHAVLLLKASFKPADNVVSVEAVLSDESYILCKDCHLTGGFAFNMWYGGDYGGDFVVTLGGYHSSYKKPAHYPDVKRLGLNWKIASNLSAEGDMYFALTPSCVMAGGGMKFLFTSSCVDAWLEVRVDIAIKWKPFLYDFYVGVCAGVRVHLGFIKFKLELGCDIHIWGPDFVGEVRIKLWCISFTVSFGKGREQPSKVIDAGQFREAFLDKTENSGLKQDNVNGGKFQISLERGVWKEYDCGGNQKEWLVCAEQLQISLKTGVPAKSIALTTDSSVKEKILYCGTEDTYVRPCELTMKKSEMTVILVRTDGTALSAEDFIADKFSENVPSALWGEKERKDETLKKYTGVRINVKQKETHLLKFAAYAVCDNKKAELSGAAQLEQRTYEADNIYFYLQQAAGEEIRQSRQQLFAGLGEEFQDIEVTNLARNAEILFCEKPKAVSIGGMWM